MSELAAVPIDDRLRWFIGTLNRVVTTAAETNGAFGLMEQWAPAGFSPPLHVHHREDSAIVLLDGELLVQRGDEVFLATPGGAVFLPRNVPHSFLVTSDQAHLYELVTPGGIEGFHIDASEPALAATLPPPGPPDVPRLVAALVPYDAEIIGPPMAATEHPESRGATPGSPTEVPATRSKAPSEA
jgi:quercetin dioxygenase-like cupin family protein